MTNFFNDISVLNTTQTNRLIGTGQAPSFELTSSVGENAKGAILGAEMAGRFSLTTGTGKLSKGLAVTFTLANPMPFSEFGILFTYSSDFHASFSVKSISANQFILSFTGDIAPSTVYSWSYLIAGF